MRSSETPKIRLVYDRTRSVKDNASPLRLQFLLPIAIPHNLVVADVRNYRFHDLERAVSLISPKWIFDFRRTARFDGLAGGRTYAFRIFENYNASYIDVLSLVQRGLPFLEMKRKSLWMRIFRSIFRKKRDVVGPILLLCDDLNYFFDLSESVLSGLDAVTGTKFGVSLLHQNFLQKAEVVLKEVM